MLSLLLLNLNDTRDLHDEFVVRESVAIDFQIACVEHGLRSRWSDHANSSEKLQQSFRQAAAVRPTLEVLN